ncbi:hypothetical protein FQR65_LT20415 [Abscondita terminalis]|nr:hypothetical protein FQR65_LT20415 [Abscondita terminalis]
MFTRLFEKYQLKFTFVNFDDVSKIAELINDKTKLIWLETPTNPLMKLVDIKAVADLIQGKDILLAVDNTFASPYLQQPLDLGADIIMHSATKYLGGHSDVVAGALVAKTEELGENYTLFSFASGGIYVRMILLRLRGTIVYPTDTIWGIGCDATNIEAIKKIYDIKHRDANKSMIILVECERRLQELVEVPELAWEMMDLSEKPITFIYDNPKGLPKELLAEDGSIGIRLVKNDFCKKLISKLNKPLVSTSANLSGSKSPLKFADIDSEILKGVDYVVEEFHDVVSEYPGSSVIKIGQDGKIKIIRE